MEKTVLSVILFFVALSVSGQALKTPCVVKIDTLTNTEIYERSDEYPDVEGGTPVLMKELRKVRISEEDYNFTGRVRVSFIVGTDGKLTGKRIDRDTCISNVEIQILKLVDNLKWIPGKCEGRNVPMLYRLHMYICLSQ